MTSSPTPKTPTHSAPRSPDPRTTFARADLADSALQGHIEAERYETPGDARIVTSLASVRSRPQETAGTITQLFYGEAVRVLPALDPTWAWVQSGTDGYVGYVQQAALGIITTSPTYRVCVGLTHAYEEPDIKSPNPMPLVMGSLIHVSAHAVKGLVATSAGWVPEAHIRPLRAKGPPPLAVAHSFLGSPYLWGGRSCQGLDCSALIQLSFQQAGLNLPRDSDQQLAFAKAHWTAVDQTHAQSGDIAFFPGHVGIIADNVHLLHANATAMAVSIDLLEQVISIIAKDSEVPFDGLYRPYV